MLPDELAPVTELKANTMKIGLVDMTAINGQFSLLLTAEDETEMRKLEDIRRRMKSIDHRARRLDVSGTGLELLVIPLEHLFEEKPAPANPLLDHNFKSVMDGITDARLEVARARRKL